MANPTSSQIQSTGFVGGGFWSKLGAGMCLALLAVYGVLWGSTVQERGGPDRYVRLTDFLSPITGATILAGPRPELLYDLHEQREVQAGLMPAGMALVELLPYNHPPFSALALQPLVQSGTPYQTMFTFWTLASAAAAGISLGVLAAAWPPRRSASWLLMLSSTSFFPLIVALMQGQSTPLVMLGWAGCSAALKLRRDWLAGVVLALAVLKPQTLPILLAALLLAGRWKALGGFLAATSLAAVIVMPFAGADWPLRYVRLLLEVLNLPSSGAITPEAMQSLRGLFSGAFGAQAGTSLALAALPAGVAALAWAWRRGANGAGGRAARWQPNGTAWDIRWAFTLFLAMLTNVHANAHDLALAIVPAWIVATLLANRALPARRHVLWVGWLWIGYALGPLVGVPGLVGGYPGVIWMLVTCAGLLWEARRAPEQAGAPVEAEEGEGDMVAALR